mgnify:CR=1 FL=1
MNRPFDQNNDMNIPASCQKCKFYYASKSWCRRYPPEHIISDNGALLSYFPSVPPTAWCGEYKPKWNSRNEQ